MAAFSFLIQSDDPIGPEKPPLNFQQISGLRRSGSPAASTQASAQDATFKSVVTGNGLNIPMLVRAGTQTLTFTGGCAAKPVSGETRFPIDAATGLTAFVTEVPVTSTAGCGETIDVNLSIPAQFEAGHLQGLFDIGGVDEVSARVRLIDANIFNTSRPLVPAAATPSVPWQLNSVPVGDHRVEAFAIIDNNLGFLRLPRTEGANGRTSVVDGQVEDLGSTFVARPHVVTGAVQLYDPAGLTDLRHLVTHALTGFGDDTTTHMRAEGVAAQAVGGGGDGAGGFARAVAQGSYDSSLGRADLNYSLRIAGLSPRDGAVDGSEALTTPWRIHRTWVRISAPDVNRQNVEITPRDDLRFDAVPDGSDEAPTQPMCFGQINLTMLSQPDIVLLYEPRLNVAGTGLATPSDDVPGAGYSLHRALATAEPRNSQDRTSEVTVRATLPEGLSYDVTPGVRLVTPDASSDTQVLLEPLQVPADGELGCGHVVGQCIEINETDGSYTGLTIAVAPNIPYCHSTGQLALEIAVDSDGQDVDSFRTRVLTDAANPLVVADEFHCGPCGPDPTENVTFSLPPGEYSLEVTAEAGVGTCTARYDAPLMVPSEPLTLQCASDTIEIDLDPGQDTIAADDSQIADQLSAATSGGCGFDIAVSDDRPEEFPVGDTVVTFETPSGLGCQTTVTVRANDNRQIAFISGETLRVHEIGTGDLVLGVAVPSLARTTSFSADGNKIGIAPAGPGNAALIFDFDNAAFTSVAGPTGSGVAFNPIDSRIIGIVTSPSAEVYELLLDRPGQNLTTPIGGAPAISTPVAAWSQDGQRIGFLFTVPTAPATPGSSPYRIAFREFLVGPQGFTISANQSVVRAPPRHEVFELVYLASGERVYSSTSGLHRITSNTIDRSADPACLPWELRSTSATSGSVPPPPMPRR